VIGMPISAAPGGAVALVSMPWGSVLKPPLALSLLKNCVKKAGCTPHLHYLNMVFAQRLGLRLYEHISERSFLHPEWFFAQDLFGPSGLAEIRNSWDDLLHHPNAKELTEILIGTCGNSEVTCKAIAQEHVPGFLSDSIEQVDWARYMAVGFATTFAQSLASLALAKRIKERYPHVKIILGGANVDSEMGVEYLRGFPWIDYIVHGEAENSFPQLLDNLCTQRWEEPVPGVSMRRRGRLTPADNAPPPAFDLNHSPAPDYSDYINALERAGFRQKMDLRLYFESSRGCWWGEKHQCTFCGLNGASITYRKKTPDKIYSEIRHLAETYRCLTFSATDNILAQDYFTGLLPRLAEMDVDFNIFYEVKANLKREQLQLLRSAGMLEIQPGIESFNTRILRLAGKGVTAIQNIQLLKWCYELGLTPVYNLLFGFPGETTDDYDGLPRLFALLAHLQPAANLQQVLFERFSPFFLAPEKFSLTLRPVDVYQFLFPQSRVRLEKIAYYFQGRWAGQQGEPAEYMQPAFDAWQLWQKHWQEQDIFCYYQKGPNYIIIHDNRPEAAGSVCGYRKIYLDEHVSALYLFCDEVRSRTAIVDMMHRRFGECVSSSMVQLWLEHLSGQGLMFSENDRYLSLAIRKPPKSHTSHPAQSPEVQSVRCQ
jgi:ribosomal peptide maturation radical SAM protein 1